MGLIKARRRLRLLTAVVTTLRTLARAVGARKVLPIIAFTPRLMQIRVVTGRFAGRAIVKMQLLLLLRIRATN